MERKDSRNVILSVLAVAILLVAIVGITYALYKFSQKGSTTNYVTTGKISMQYTESDTNVISIANAVPMKDAVGKIQKDYFDFTLSSSISGKAKINYEIRAELIDVSPKKQLDPSLVKLYLEKKESGTYTEQLKPTIFQINEDTVLTNSDVNTDTMLLYTGTFGNIADSNSYSDDFRLRMWIKEGTNLSNEEQSFKVKVNVYASME